MLFACRAKRPAHEQTTFMVVTVSARRQHAADTLQVQHTLKHNLLIVSRKGAKKI